MTLLARRERDRVERCERALLGMRDAVVAEMPHLPSLGSSPIDEAVDRALDEIRAQGQHLAADPAELRRLWVLYARWRLIDRGRSAESRRRERTPVEEHAEALAVSGSCDLAELTEGYGQGKPKRCNGRLAPIVANCVQVAFAALAGGVASAA